MKCLNCLNCKIENEDSDNTIADEKNWNQKIDLLINNPEDINYIRMKNNTIAKFNYLSNETENQTKLSNAKISPIIDELIYNLNLIQIKEYFNWDEQKLMLKKCVIIILRRLENLVPKKY
ncbi:MAG: hypothetical protein MHPSP_004496, partial [Paramarteilia canceri]